MSIGSKIKIIRKENKLTQVELAKKANISRSYLADIENNRYNPSLETLKSLANALGISVNKFFNEENEATETSVNKDILLNKKDEKDIAKDLDNIMDKLTNQEDGPLYYNGDELGSDDRELFKDALELALKTVKLKNKEKYTPKKYKK
ncbi:helix-turn-helix domain-containing protein [Clostridium hydrogeniformans]|uniref:helix-turn-helix domain-containing protein n=1 Tax=Clostridium hydrogeniformans TaxID=349933 RepID=UPI00048970D0|nr:helix-turn-helix domain-containing protein [Clostridium hydrogeniformans]